MQARPPIRVLAPAGGFPSPWELGNAFFRYRLSLSGQGLIAAGQLETLLSIEGRGPGTSEELAIFLISSGKAALLSALRAQRKKTAKPNFIASAYTCPDVAAAIIRAGFSLVLADVCSETLGLEKKSVPKELLEQSAGVVLSNLYGLPDRVEPWRESPGSDFLVIDDACQAFQSFEGDFRVGLRPGTLGVLSFGRGKSLCGVGGGAVIGPKDLVSEIRSQAEMGTSISSIQSLKDVLYCAAAWCFERPFLFSIPSAIPSVGLGETRFELNFSCERMSSGQLLVALAAMGRFSKAALEREEQCHRLESALKDIPGLILPSASFREERGFNIQLLRFPVLFTDSSRRDKALRALKAAGLGASASYPRTLESYSELHGRVFHGELLGARKVAASLLTLPLHRFVTAANQDEMRQIITATAN